MRQFQCVPTTYVFSINEFLTISFFKQILNHFQQFQFVPTTYVIENKEENYLEIYIFQVACPLSLPLLNIPNCR